MLKKTIFCLLAVLVATTSYAKNNKQNVLPLIDEKKYEKKIDKSIAEGEKLCVNTFNVIWSAANMKVAGKPDKYIDNFINHSIDKHDIYKKHKKPANEAINLIYKELYTDIKKGNVKAKEKSKIGGAFVHGCVMQYIQTDIIENNNKKD